MKRWLALTALALGVAVATHFAVVLSCPYLLMHAAELRIEKHAHKGENQWIDAPRITEKSRRVVRPSPDLAYAVCIYDLARGPVHVTAAPWDDYMSVSVFAQSSDNIFVVDDRQAPQGVDLLIVPSGAQHPAGPWQVVESPSRRGIVLQRRLAPTQDRWNKANAAWRHDICAALSG